MNYAPVLISVYDRYEHFQLCIASLQGCAGAAETPLYIAIDYPKQDSGLEKHAKIVGFAKSITGFGHLTLFIRDHNLGSRENIWTARQEIFKSYDRLIFSEDDNEFAPGFLEYINDSLQYYAGDSNIFAVNGYNYPIKVDDVQSGDVFAFQGYCAWGAGMWRDKWSRVDWTRMFARRFLRNPKNLIRTYKLAPAYILHFLSYAWQGRFAGDAIILMNLIKNDWFTLNPVQSLVRNHGCEGSGEHRSQDDRFSRQSLNPGNPDPSHLLNDPDYRLVLMRLRRYFRLDISACLRFLITCLPFHERFQQLVKVAVRHSPL